MTPEELNSRIEFIIESLARLAASQQEHQETLARLEGLWEEDRRSRLQLEAWSKGMMSRVIELLDLQSQRLDRQDKFYRDSLKQAGEYQTRTEAFQRQALRHEGHKRFCPPRQPAW